MYDAVKYRVRWGGDDITVDLRRINVRMWIAVMGLAGFNEQGNELQSLKISDIISSNIKFVTYILGSIWKIIRGVQIDNINRKAVHPSLSCDSLSSSPHITEA